MITRQEQILVHEVLTPSKTLLGTTFLSKLIPYGLEPGWILIIRNGAAITGTTPGIVWELDASTAADGSSMTRVGAAIAAQVAAGVLVVPYYTASTQGPIGSTTT